MKRYVIECANDFIRACENAGRMDLVKRLDKVRNAYICEIVLTMDAMRSLVKIMEEENDV